MWGGAQNDLAAADHDVVWVGDRPDSPSDEEVLAWAHREQRVLATLDKDFGELAIVYELPHAGIIRVVNFPARKQAAVCLHVLEQYAEELQAGAIITAEPGRIRVRTRGTGEADS